MKIAVCIKRAAVLGDDIEFTDDTRGIDPDYLDFVLNEWDTCAVEEALRLREANGGEVVLFSVGDKDCERELRRCLAMGADRAIRVWADSLEHADPITVAQALAETIAPEQPDLIFCGAQSSDSMQGATAAALAQFLDLPVVAVVTKIEYEPQALKATVHRELEGGLIDVVETEVPAVLSIQTGINEPRYVTLRAIQETADRAIAVHRPDTSSASGYTIARMFVPVRQRAETITGKPAQVAERILEIVREAVQQ